MSDLHDFSSEQFQFIKQIILIQFNAERKCQLPNAPHKTSITMMNMCQRHSTRTYSDADRHCFSSVSGILGWPGRQVKTLVFWPVGLLLGAYSCHWPFLELFYKMVQFGSSRFLRDDLVNGKWGGFNTKNSLSISLCELHVVFRADLRPSKFPCWSPNTQYLRMWPDLRQGL